ncbi:penicillin-binding protein 1A, partial [Salmonella enterica subsp. enterica serovar Enteritidis]|nr:penicillin-binding protein 1A [Salmonella enterica subsp. enterica serovar Enteritidis]
MKDGTQIKVPWSNMRWATLHYRNPNSAFISNNIVNLHDIVYVTSNADNTSWSLVQIPAVEGSLVSVNPETGALLAVVGGFDFNKSKFNRAIQGYRQPGSTIKPLVYTTALEKGFSPDTMISDDPLTVGSWKPKNSDGRNLGMIPLRKGLYLSRNLVSIRVLRSAGISDTRELLNEFGLEKERMPNTLSLALGSGEATPLQMATGYA